MFMGTLLKHEYSFQRSIFPNRSYTLVALVSVFAILTTGTQSYTLTISFLEAMKKPVQ